MSTARVDFTRGAAERIANVVRIVERGDRDLNALTFRRPAFESTGSAVRIGTFTGPWDKYDTATITLTNVPNTPNTATALNLFADIAVVTAATAHCAIARDGTTWYLIAAECP